MHDDRPRAATGQFASWSHRSLAEVDAMTARFPVDEAGRRWLAGELMEDLASEYKVGIGTMRMNLHAAGFHLSVEEILARQKRAKEKKAAERAAAEFQKPIKHDPLLQALRRASENCR